MQEKSNMADIRTLNEQDIIDFFKISGLKSFKGKQVWEWLWKKHVLSFDEMTNISVNERNLLKDNFYLNQTKIHNTITSKDGTVKVIFSLYDGNLVEGVLIPERERVTACISSQAGCAYGCKYCATGLMGFKRNLVFFEIYDQVALLGKLSNKFYDKNLTNIVFMGMGEPLANYNNTKQAINLICSKKAMAMSPSRITLSSVGIIEGINELAKDNIKYNLAISLHTANNEKRNKIMPVNKKNNLDNLQSALKNFYKKTNNRITIEYLIIDNFNDSKADAMELAKYCKPFPVKINIIEYNPVKNILFKKSSQEKTKEFANTLENFNLIVNIRKSKGKDIDAACGQLATMSNSTIQNRKI